MFRGVSGKKNLTLELFCGAAFCSFLTCLYMETGNFTVTLKKPQPLMVAE